MTSVSDPTRACARIQAQVDAIGRLRGSGPNPFDYDLWNSRTLEVLRAIYGEDSAEMQSYVAATGVDRDARLFTDGDLGTVSPQLTGHFQSIGHHRLQFLLFMANLLLQIHSHECAVIPRLGSQTITAQQTTGETDKIKPMETGKEFS